MSNSDCKYIRPRYQVLRNEEIARQKALAVLDILCSRAMAKARARWLKEALERSMKVQTRPAPKACSRRSPRWSSIHCVIVT